MARRATGLKIVKTTEARNKIKQWFKKECREENIVQGRAELDRELRANLLFNGFYDSEEVQKNALDKFSFSSLDELYASIGYGGITVTKVLNKIKDDVHRLRRAQEKVEHILQPQPAKKRPRASPASLSRVLTTAW